MVQKMVKHNQIWNQVQNQVWDQIWNQVQDRVWNQVWNQVGNEIRGHIWNQELDIEINGNTQYY